MHWIRAPPIVLERPYSHLRLYPFPLRQRKERLTRQSEPLDLFTPVMGVESYEYDTR